MPGRQSTGPPTLRQSNPKKKKPKRSLDALAIAEKLAPIQSKIRQNRLGESEPHAAPKRKRSREEDEELSGEDSAKKRLKAQKRRSEDDLELRSDSSGNEWMVGQVDDENDSELDSDEAMGVSDEERFEGYIFRGSSSQKPAARTGSKKERRPEAAEGKPEEYDLREEDGDATEEEGHDFGDEGVDLANVLDSESSVEAKLSNHGRRGQDFEPDRSGSVSEGNESDEDSTFDKESELSVTDDEDDNLDSSKLASLQAAMSTLNGEESGTAEARAGDTHESLTPSEFGLTSRRKLTLADLAPTVTDPRMRKSLKILADNASTSSKKRIGIPKKLDAPLPKRQQDRIDRVAAYEKSKETLSRWIDTVKYNRRAEHLSFPLQDPHSVIPPGQNRLLPNTQFKPLTDLESTIQSILQDSGLTSQKGKSEEDQIQAWEELKTRKLPIEEVIARRAELRARRELLFREEMRAKRIKKIKSKTYRKIHRKERERNAARLKEALANEEGDSESEKERNDKRRAEERMGARHKESRWAKGVKNAGRAKWDDDARDGMSEMFRRDEELRKRIQGKDIRDEDDSDESSEDDEGNDSEDEDGQRQKLQDRLQSLQAGSINANEGGPSESGLSNMAFMKKAEASRRAQNDADAEKLRRGIAGEDSPSEDDGADELGRQLYGPQKKPAEGSHGKKTAERSEFEERESSDVEDVDTRRENDVDMDRIIVDAGRGLGTIGPISPKNMLPQIAVAKGSWNERSGGKSQLSQEADKASQNTKSVAKSRQDAPSADLEGAETTETAREGDNALISISQPPMDPNTSDEEEAAQNHPIVFSNAELARRAFAGDDVLDKFIEEKREIVHEQEDKLIDNTLPGWGTWVGEGIGKKASKPRARHRSITKIPGIAPENRKDAKLKDVIISEKRVKKNGKYLAGQLPHPFETRAQYERSLRLSVGPEWTTKETFQSMTKPRVLMKQGIIAPMVRPIV